jgi:hypothetical protein
MALVVQYEAAPSVPLKAKEMLLESELKNKGKEAKSLETSRNTVSDITAI